MPGGVPDLGGYLPGPRGCTCLVLGVCTWSKGVYLPGPGGVPTWSRGMYLVWGVYLPGPGGVPAWSQGRAWSGTPPMNRMTHRCKNITLAKTSFRPVMIIAADLYSLF